MDPNKDEICKPIHHDCSTEDVKKKKGAQPQASHLVGVPCYCLCLSLFLGPSSTNSIDLNLSSKFSSPAISSGLLAAKGHTELALKC